MRSREKVRVERKKFDIQYQKLDMSDYLPTCEKGGKTFWVEE